MTSSLQAIYSSVLEGDSARTQREVTRALSEGENAGKILQHGLIAAMQEVGCRFEKGVFYVPEMMIAARAMQSGLELLKPHLVDHPPAGIAKVAIGTVAGDLHNIGKNLVALMLEGAGFIVDDLGVDVPLERFVEAAHQGAQVLALSALLTTTMSQMRDVIRALDEEGMRKNVLVMVGGAPVTQEFSDLIGADIYAPDAASAARMLHEAFTER